MKKEMLNSATDNDSYEMKIKIVYYKLWALVIEVNKEL